MKAIHHLAVGLAAVVATGCAAVALHTAPKKIPATTRSPAALAADEQFWKTLHAGDYGAIDAALRTQKTAYLETPNDAVTAAHIGFLHIWRLSERARLSDPSPLITDDAVLARRYFEEAVNLDPTDARILGFLGSTQLAEGTIHGDARMVRQGYFNLKDGINAWPEFNLFTAGYVLSNQAADSPRFKEGLAWQWKTLDVCSGERVDRQRPDFRRYLHKETTVGPQRACWNSWIAPHNFEGFFLNMGDMLVKSGDWKVAIPIYENAKYSKTFDQWPYKKVLQDRIERAEQNVAIFNGPDTNRGGPSARIMISSTYACAACHQR